jgi:translation initiation factor IF-1
VIQGAEMKNSLKKEEILLDARLVDALGCATFLAELENGHEIVAFSTPKKPLTDLGLRIGDSVKVALSPYDMLKGIIQVDHLQEISS